MHRPPTHDAIVVGGRLAGASTAMLLARAGLRVLVLERAPYGSDLLSTHAFMRGGVLQLSRWGVLDGVVAAGTPAVHRTTVRYHELEEIIEIAPIPGCDALYAPRRTVLDRLLADAARDAGADLRFEHSATGLLRGPGGRVTGVTYRDAHGDARVATAPLVIGADGPRSTVAKSVGADPYVAARHATAFVVGYWSGVEADGYQWLYAPGATAGIIPTNDGQVCAWVGMPSTRFGSVRRTADHGFREVMGHVAGDWLARLDAGAQHGPLRGFPGIRGFLRTPYGPGWALVGDAGYVKDPITAHGMTDALRDAELLARAVERGLGAGPAELHEAMAGYHRTRDGLSRELFDLADRVAAYDWNMDELRGLLVGMSLAMRDEVFHLSALDALAPA